MEEQLLRFKVEMSSTSFQQVKQQIADLKREVEGLAKALQGIKLPGQGGGLLSGISTGKPISGLPSSSGATTGAQSPGQAIGGILTQGLQADRNLFRTITEGSKEALRAMKDALKQSAQEQEQIIKRLKGEIDSLSKSYNTLANTGGLGAGLQAGDLGAMLDKGRQLSAAQKNLAATNAAMGEGGGGGFMGMAGRALSGGGLAAFGTVGAAIGIGAGAWLYNKGANAYYTARDANLQWQVDKPIASLSAAGQIGGTMGGLALGVRGGDIASAMSLNQLMKHGTISRILSTSNSQARKLLAMSQSGQTYKLSDLTSTLGDEAGTELYRTLSGEQDAQARKTILFNRAMLAAGPDKTRQIQDAVSARNNLNLQESSDINDFYNRRWGNLAVTRQLGVSETSRDGVWRDQAKRWQEKFAGMGLSLEQGAAFVEQAGRSIGRGNRFMGAGLLKRQFGGYENVLDIYNIGQQYGNGQALVDVIGGRGGVAGRGGIDAKAAVMMGAMVQNQMENSTMGFNGIEFAKGLGAVIGTGEGIGGQLRTANQIKAGLSMGTADLAGQLDPLNAAINAYAGANAFGGDIYAMNAMGRLTPGEMTTMLREGRVTDKLASRGLTISQVREYMATKDQFSLSRYMQTGRGTQVDKIVMEAKAAGGPMAYLQQQLGGLSKKEQRKRFGQITDLLGAGIADSYNISDEVAIGDLKRQAAAFLEPSLGGGLWDPSSKKDLTRGVIAGEGRVAGQQAETTERNVAAISEIAPTMAEMGTKITQLGVGILNGGGNVETAFNRLATFLNEKFQLGLTFTPGGTGTTESAPPLSPDKATTKDIQEVQRKHMLGARHRR